MVNPPAILAVVAITGENQVRVQIPAVVMVMEEQAVVVQAVVVQAVVVQAVVVQAVVDPNK
jgi:ribosomal protein L21